MTITTRKTSTSLIIESDGIDTSYGPNCLVQGAWVGKVVVPLASLTEGHDKHTGDSIYKWSPGDCAYAVETGGAGRLFNEVASGSWLAPKGCRRYDCRQIH